MSARNECAECFRDVASIDERGALMIGEPLKGKMPLTPDEFARRYTFDAFAMELAPRSPRAK